jgi:hypothetical protein
VFGGGTIVFANGLKTALSDVSPELAFSAADA